MGALDFSEALASQMFLHAVERSNCDTEVSMLFSSRVELDVVSNAIFVR